MVAYKTTSQSHDPKSPTPLGPGVNKGNVDNVTGPVYYSFQGGPGRATMNFGFKSLGIFGYQLKESLSLDIYENGNQRNARRSNRWRKSARKSRRSSHAPRKTKAYR
jgi:hypothetical protein